MTRSPFPFAATAAVCLASTLIAGAAGAELAQETDDACLEIRKLKELYLTCEHSAQTTGMPRDEVAGCSEIYYELKARAFDDDFGRLRAWYDLRMTLGPDTGSTPASGGPDAARSCG